MEKTIEIKCEGASTLDIDQLHNFQGNLKSLSEANYEKFKGVLLEHGVSEPISVWVHDGKNYILNGHQRHFVLQKLRADGYFVPKVPVSFVQAKDYTQAKQKVLTLTSQYGSMTQESLSDFMIDSGLGVDFLETSVVLPEIDMEYFGIEVPDAVMVTSHERVKSMQEYRKDYDPTLIKNIVLVFDQEQYAQAMCKIEEIKSATGLETNTEAVLEALNNNANHNSPA